MMPRHYQLLAINAQSRSGISLIEVLASVFVISIGLLGVLAVVPYGAFQAKQARHAEYAANMTANAAAELLLRGMAKPAQWEIKAGNNLESGGTVVRTEVALNCSKILLVETAAATDPAAHIFRIGATLEHHGKEWAELEWMTGQDDLNYVTEAETRPDLSKAKSSGRYTWFFTYKPETETKTPWGFFEKMQDAAIVKWEFDGGIKLTFNSQEIIDKFVKISALNEITEWEIKWSSTIDTRTGSFTCTPPTDAEVTSETITVACAGSVFPFAKDEQDTSDPDSEKNPANYLLTVKAPPHDVLADVNVDILGCYNRVPVDDRQVSWDDAEPVIDYFQSSFNGGVFTLPSAEYNELLAQTKYVLVTWENAGTVTGKWCKILFIDKNVPAEPKLYVFGEGLPATTAMTGTETEPHIKVYIPSGVLYHKQVGKAVIKGTL